MKKEISLGGNSSKKKSMHIYKQITRAVVTAHWGLHLGEWSRFGVTRNLVWGETRNHSRPG